MSSNDDDSKPPPPPASPPLRGGGGGGGSFSSVPSRRFSGSGKANSLKRFFSSLSMDLEEKNEDGADGSSSHPSSSGKKKCLVVHGWRSNAKVSKEHAKHLNLEGKFDKIHLMKGTSRAKEAADEVTEGMFLGPWFSWVDDIHGETAGEDLVKALQHVVKFVGAHGPYASVVGFSQGGALVSLLSRREVLEKLGVEDDVFLWKSAVVVCGASAGLIDIAEKALGIRLSDNDDEKRGKRIDDDDDDVMPSLHVFGVQDDRKPQGERLMKLFHAKMPSSGQIVRHCLYFDGGHGVPKSIMSDLAFHAEYDAWLENALSMQIVDVDEAPKGFKSKTVARMRTGKKIRRETSSGRGGSDRALGNLTNEQNDDAMERGEGETENAITTFSTVTRLSATPRDESVVTKTTPSGHGLHFIRDACSVANCDADVKIRKGRLDILEMLRAAPTSAPLLRDLDTSRAPMTYGKMIDFITTGEGDLRKIGATQSTVIAYNVPTGPIGASAFLSIAAQCTAVPLDPGITEADAFEALVSCKVTLVALFRGTDTDEIEKAATKANIPIKWYVVAAGNTAAGCFSPEKDESASTQSPPLVNAAEGVGLLLRTSGTTSKSKVVPLVLGALTSNGSELAASLELISDDVCINAMPLFHIGGLSCSILATVASKASVICCHKFDAQVFYDTIVTDNAVKPTWYSAVPTIHVAVLQYGNAISRGAKPKHSLRFIRSGAAALSQADAEKLQAFWNVPIIPTYSMSEQMPISGKNIHLDLAERPNTVGQPLICSVALVNDGNCRATVPFGTQGELVISGDNVMTGYQDAAEANNKTFFYIGEKRYLRTGDIAKMDSDGFIYLTGRSKELIKRGGEQVSPLKVEAVVAKHPDVHVAVVFGVESPLWGEEVGIAIVLKDGVDDIDASLRSIREMTISSKELSRFEHPAYWKIVKDDDLPKTSTKKYKRAGLAKHLNIAQRNIVSMCSRKKGGSAKPAVISSGLAGLRYCMAVGVMFNHIGGVWQGEDERNPLTYGPYWWSAKATTFYFPATVFFVLGGFTLSAALNGKEVRKGTWLSFYNSRFQTLMPLYLLSLAFGLINMLVVCRPSTFSDKFSWQPHNATMTLASGAAAQCHTSPVEMPYGAWLIMTIFVFAFGFQTWFPLWLLSSWMMYYTWFNGVYYFIIIIFPWMHNALCRVRGDVNAILKWGVVYTILIFATGALLGVYYALPSWQDYDDLGSSKSWKKNLQNIYALSTMMFPPYWAPSVGSGMVAYFWYDAVRPNESHDKKRYGRMADCLTLAFFAFHLAHFFDIDWPYPTSLVGKMWEKHPDEHHRWDTGIKRYVWSVMITRLYSPLLAVWIALLAMPRGSLTGRFLEGNVLTKTLAPTSYGCFLFHQIIGQWYWWATRSGNKVTSDEVDLGNSEAWSWWAYPKEYYWFSPQPLPVAWYEFFFVVGLVTIFSAFIDRALNSHLTLLWVKMMNFFQNIIWLGSVSSAAETGGGSPESIVRNAVKALTGVESDISLDDSFDEIGLVSVGLPILVGLINSEDKSASVTVADVANCATLRDLVSVLEKNRKVAEGAAGVGARNDL